MINGDGNWGCIEVLEVLRMRRLVLSGVKSVGLVKCLLNELAMFLLELWMMLLNFIERLGSVEVGSLLFKDLIVFQ